MTKAFTTFFVFFLTVFTLAAQSPKREMRATWIATVMRIDWPQSYGATAQKNELAQILDSVKGLNMNAVFFQVRSRCDAMYNSAYEPWSSDLGNGRGTDPGYDPLAFAIEECHKRGIECHAWLNPYRYSRDGSGWTNIGYDHPLNYENTHPEWLLWYSNNVVCDPALPEVRVRIKSVVGDILSKYDVDGIIFDDYFYPYGGTTSQDAASVTKYKPAGMDVHDWRRDNVNRMIADVYDTIQSVRPWVTFGVSPFGIWTNNTAVAAKEGITLPSGIYGGEMYQEIYCDPVAWMKAGTIDYISPQLYWASYSAGQKYGVLCPWWADLANRFGIHFYASMANYKYNENTENYTIEELKTEALFNRTSSKDDAPGSVFYNLRAWYEVNNQQKHRDFRNLFRNTVFTQPALTPAISWKPANDQGMVTFNNPAITSSVLSWIYNETADNVRYAVYAVPLARADDPGVYSKSDYLLGISYVKEYKLPNSVSTSSHRLAVSVLDRYGNEFAPRVLEQSLVDPAPAQLVYPNNYAKMRIPVTFRWSAVDKADCYVWQLATDADFTDIVCTREIPNIQPSTSAQFNTSTQMNIKEDGGTYYWRVRTRKANAGDVWSDTRRIIFSPDGESRIDVADYPDPEQETGVIALSNYEFEAEGSPVNPDWLSNYNIKRVLYRNEELYVLTTDPKILVINAKTTELIKELNLTGTENLSDIAFTADKFLLACSKEIIAPENPTNSFKVYTWDDNDSAPYLLFQSSKSGNCPNGTAGETFAASGSRWNCKVYTTVLSTESYPGIYRVAGFHYNEDEGGVMEDKWMDANYSLPCLTVGEHPIFTITPNGNNDRLSIDSDGMVPTEFQFDWSKANGEDLVKVADFAEVSGYELSIKSSGGNFFRNAGHSYLVMPVCEDDGSKTGAVLFDVNDGLDKARKVSEKYPEEGLGTTPAAYMTAVAVVNGYEIELMVLAKNQGMARFRNTDVPTANIYASELSFAEGFFRFTLNENAQSVIFTIYKENETISSHNAGALEKGRHAFTNPFGGMDFDAWSVTTTARPTNYPTKVSDDSPKFQFYLSRGVAIDNNMESPFFGRVYISEAAGGTVTEGTAPSKRTTQTGMYILDAALQDITNQGTSGYAGGVSWAANLTDSYQLALGRSAVAPDGKVYITNSTYAQSGMWMMDPANPSADFVQVFGGTRNATGTASHNGATIHNQITHCWISGKGDQTRLYTLDRDYATNLVTNAIGNIYQYNIGDLSALPWSSAPSAIVYNDISNGNIAQNAYGSIAPDARGGWWVCQYRAASGNSIVPALFHVTNGTVNYNCGTAYPSSYQGGMAVSIDGSLLAMGTTGGNVEVFDVEYNESNVPTLHSKYVINWGKTSDYLFAAALDVAGNLYLTSSSNERLMVYSLPKDDNSYTSRVSQSGGVGIKAVKGGEVKVYPNPVVSDLFIDGQGLKAYTLFDLNGRTIRTGSIHSNQSQISIENIASGIYILQIKTTEGIIIKRIIKQ